MAEEDVVHPEGRRRVRRAHGGRARPLRRDARRAAAGRLLRRDAAAADRRGARPDRRRSPASPRAIDYEYVRNGTANVFMFVDVHRPWRHAKVTDRRTVRRLRRVHARPRRRPLPEGRTHPRRARQPLDALRRRRSTRRSRPPRRAASCAGSSSTTRRSTRAGSTWSRSRSA